MNKPMQALRVKDNRRVFFRDEEDTGNPKHQHNMIRRVARAVLGGRAELVYVSDTVLDSGSVIVTLGFRVPLLGYRGTGWIKGRVEKLNCETQGDTSRSRSIVFTRHGSPPNEHGHREAPYVTCDTEFDDDADYTMKGKYARSMCYAYVEKLNREAQDRAKENESQIEGS